MTIKNNKHKQDDFKSFIENQLGINLSDEDYKPYKKSYEQHKAKAFKLFLKNQLEKDLPEEVYEYYKFCYENSDLMGTIEIDKENDRMIAYTSTGAIIKESFEPTEEQNLIGITEITRFTGMSKLDVESQDSLCYTRGIQIYNENNKSNIYSGVSFTEEGLIETMTYQPNNYRIENLIENFQDCLKSSQENTSIKVDTKEENYSE